VDYAFGRKRLLAVLFIMPWKVSVR
jgi:hypothetical protein